MTVRNRTVEFFDYVTRRKSAWDLGYSTYGEVLDAIYQAESNDDSLLTPELSDEFVKYWSLKEPDVDVSMPPSRFRRARRAVVRRWPEKFE